MSLVRYESCPVRRNIVSAHAIPEAAAARVGGLRYNPDPDGGSGGWVVAVT
jgi:hypothetical protein